MSYHDMYPFDHMEEDDFFDDVDEQEEFDAAAEDVPLDEYEMVGFQSSTFFLLDFCINFLFFEFVLFMFSLN